MALTRRKLIIGLNRGLTAVFLALCAAVLVFPFYLLAMESFHPNIIVLPYPVNLLPSAFSLSNYRYLFVNYPVLRWIGNSLVIAAGTSVLQLAFCSTAAFGFCRTDFLFRDQLFWLLMVMLVVPIQMQILPLFLVMSHLHWINTFLSWIPFASDAFGIFLLRQYMESIPKDYDESAYMDGAGLISVYSRIILPQIRPAIIVLLTFNFITQWNDFLYPLIVVNSQQMYTLQLGLADLYSSATRGEGGGMGVALAGAVVSFIPTLLIYLAFQNRIVEGMNRYAGVKG